METNKSFGQNELTVGLLWHSLSSDNFGVGALTLSQMAICKDAADQIGINLRYILLGTQGGSSYCPDGFVVEIGSRITLRGLISGKSGFLRDLDKCNVVLDIGEGDSFTDIYGIRRYLPFIFTKIIVLVKQKRLILCPQTIGPFDRWYTRVLAVMVMKRCESVLARDSLSAKYLVSQGVSSNNEGLVDVAFKLPFRIGHSKSKKIRIGVNVSGLLFSGGYSGTNQFGLSLDYPALVRSTLAKWLMNSENEVWLIPHVVPNDLPRDDDREANRILMKEFPTVKVAPDFSGPSDAKSFISSMDFVTGARMHACIAAFSSGVPVIPVAYSRKFDGLFSSLGYKWVANAKAMDNETAENLIMHGFSNRHELAISLASGNKIANLKLAEYTQKLIDIFKTEI